MASLVLDGRTRLKSGIYKLVISLPIRVTEKSHQIVCDKKKGSRERNQFRNKVLVFINLFIKIMSSASGAKMSAVELEPSLMVKKKACEISNELKGTSIFLVGMNCSMKSNLGKLLADALRYYYFDVDSLVEQAAGGKSAAKSFRETDEKGFRDSESEVLKQLSSMGRLVVCAGDGAVQSSTNLALMRHGISIWIDVPLDMLANEIRTTEVPTSVLQATSDSDSFTEVPQELAKLFYEMREGYGTADAKVSLQRVATQLGYEDLSTVTVEDMAVETLKEIERLTRVKKMMEEAARPF